MAARYKVGQRLSFESDLCTVRYIGPVEGTKGEWLGVEWDNPARGKHDGTYNGKEYFFCRNSLAYNTTSGSFVRPSRQPDPTQSFVEAVRQKYASDDAPELSTVASLDNQHVISGKVVEEVGFEKITRQLAQLDQLTTVIVDGLRINKAETETSKIRETCPKVMNLDLSRNLFKRFEPVGDICEKLDELKILKLNGNKFEDYWFEDSSVLDQRKFVGVKELQLDEVHLIEVLLFSIASHYPSLTTLTMSTNNLRSITTRIPTHNLTSLILENNGFESISHLAPLVHLKSLQNLLLKKNNISIMPKEISKTLNFGSQLKYVDLSYNSISRWSFIDDLPSVFPGLEQLRTSGNPLYDSMIEELGQIKGTEVCYTLTLARLGKLKKLNFSEIDEKERVEAELYYLSTIGKALGEASKELEHTIISQHKRYYELCELHGAPVVVRTNPDQIDPEFLEARLIKFTFYIAQTQKELPFMEIPKSFNTYRVKGLLGRELSRPPLSLRLIWETQQLDPVEGYEDEESDDDEEMAGIDTNQNDNTTSRGGKWMKREIEIEDGTKQIGNWIDGLEALVRVEFK